MSSFCVYNRLLYADLKVIRSIYSSMSVEGYSRSYDGNIKTEDKV